jgi:hypothetical protein
MLGVGPRTSDVGRRISDRRRRTSDIGRRASDLDLGPQPRTWTSDLNLRKSKASRRDVRK